VPLEVPNLDDRRWADLVDEARSLIPRFAPRWTDHNVHDPGITFIELFAWLAEMQIYQLNRVGARHREVFGRLAGVRRRPRQPARITVVASGTPTTLTRLPAGTQIVPLEGEEFVFETTLDITLTRSRLQRVVVDDGVDPVDQTAANATGGIVFLAFGERASEGASLRLGFDAFYPDEPSLRLTVDVFTADLVSRCGADSPVTDDAADVPDASDAAPAVVVPVQLAWEYLGPGQAWLRLTVIDDETRALSQSGAVTLSVPAQAAHASPRDPVWIRARIVRGSYDIEPRLRFIGMNALPCVQRETVRDEQYGRGNGRPDQSFTLSKLPLLMPESGPPVTIEVENETWTLVSLFDASDPTSQHYTFDADSGLVTFGNGVNGRVPLPGQVLRAREYQVSQGRNGNVTKGLAWRFRTAVVPGITLTNPEPAAGGADPESLNDLELRARAQLSQPASAVTLSDVERLTLGTPGVYVARAHAIPNYPVPERITVVAVPKVRPGRQGPPSPASSTFLDAVRQHLEAHRLLCDNIRVVGPIFVEVRVAARLRLTKGAGAAAAIARARQALDRFFAGEARIPQPEPVPMAPPSPCPTQWPFGRSVFPSEVLAVLDQVAGVDAVLGLTLTGHRGTVAIAADASGAIPVPPIGLVFSGAHDLIADAAADRRSA
jgi:predicted phage baseplate assembly protein